MTLTEQQQLFLAKRDGKGLASWLYKQCEPTTWKEIEAMLSQAQEHCASQTSTTVLQPKVSLEESNHPKTENNSIATLSDVSVLSPRGRYNIAFSLKKLELQSVKKTPGMDVEISSENLAYLLKIPKPDPIKKNVVKHYTFVLVLKSPLRNGKLLIVALNGPTTVDKKKSVILKRGNSTASALLDAEFIDSASSSSLSSVLDKCFVTTFPNHSVIRTKPEVSPCESSFLSTAGHVYVKCYFKTSDGLLYLLPEGLLFMTTPLIFIPRSQVVSIQCGRGGSASSKTFDLDVELEDGSHREFGMIEREELPSITEYVRAIGQMNEKDTVVEKDNDENENYDNENDDEEEDFLVESSDESSDSEDLSGDAMASSSDDNSGSDDEEPEADSGTESDDSSSSLTKRKRSGHEAAVENDAGFFVAKKSKQ